MVLSSYFGRYFSDLAKPFDQVVSVSQSGLSKITDLGLYDNFLPIGTTISINITKTGNEKKQNLFAEQIKSFSKKILNYFLIKYANIFINLFFFFK